MKVVFVALALIAVAYGQRAQPCKTSADCKPEECCVHDPFSKRFLGDLWGEEKGFCEGRKMEGDFCSASMGGMDELWKVKDGMHSFSCPCASGLECVPEDIHTDDGLVVHMNPRCTATEGSGDF
ncbi:unnamed protein product [Owenia fusiformis]|uniref:Uncharacterized protein n=1 Tax=Owenia fusiformis TaxID=6347 RepID=A0A8J1TTT6_OWEFU|nr:unnamed protein product [Owenia fusiformis]